MLFAAGVSSIAQESAPTSQDQSEPARQVAQIPDSDPDVVFVEAEDAVATTFDTQPILNYSVSNRRSLQLNRFNPLQDGTPFFADYVFFVDAPGTYELWYGGTPPGPEDDLFASYHSPFAYRLDDEQLVAVHREDVNVVSEYSPGYFWNRLSELELTAGRHTLRFQVSDRRRFDNKFLFYLDAFFLLRAGSSPRPASQPDVFPQDRSERGIDVSFGSIGGYERLLRAEPNNGQHLMDLGKVYSMVGDYLNAIKFFRRARLVDERNLDASLLLAKNQIWRGDVAAGLQRYQELLNADPDRLETWLEAGKVAAWTQQYGKSVQFLSDALARFPNDADATVNLGLPYLWAGLVNDAERTFEQAWQATAGELDARRTLRLTFTR